MGKFSEQVAEDLIIYVRYCAWLSAIPESKNKSDEQNKTRRELLSNINFSIEMPKVIAGEHLLKYLFEVGPTISTGMGNTPLTFQELKAWQDTTRVVLNGWEARLLRRLSNEYLSESQKAREFDCESPYSTDSYQPSQAVIASGMKNSMKQLISM